MKKRHFISLIVLAGFFIFCSVSLSQSLTPYVTFAQAKAKATGSVQVKGVLASPKITELTDRQGISFFLRDDQGEEALVVYHGSRIDNMDHSESIVAIGSYQNGQFNAEKLLVKCPSKYQGSVDK